MKETITSKEHFFVNTISEWFQKNQRILPFRGTKDPYKIWVSEIMLQQTRVGAVVSKFENKYERFLKRFPDIFSLAKADIKEILEIWSGLGYYHRAIHLHKTAKIVVEQFNGKFPDEYHLLIKLPGIGDYTASAILSIAYEKAYPVFDGNVKRLTYRFFYKQFQQFKDNDIKKRLKKIFEETQMKPSVINQAMMEYGSLICIYKFPKCKNCILFEKCDVKNYPREIILNIPPRKEKQKKDVTLLVYIVKNHNKILIIKDQTFILKNHYFFPYQIPEKNILEPPLLRESNSTYIGQIKHHIMHYNLLAKIFLIDGEKNHFTINYNDKIETQWIDIKEINTYLYTSFARKILNLLSQQYLLF